VFNSCLLNLYSDGLEGMAWHSDDEKELGRNTVIASVSFGATRKFAFKHKRTGEKRELMLSHGQLIVMRGETQSHWLHAVMKSAKIREPRVNLTFRTILQAEM
ncbi:alpha-ketoglutarate-dependent dioxygenase AlkB, partial [Neisseria dentiae]|uniref:alpha-ketoglutarate-dependent dioxygenase AlkB family protein n=1 Tax=Neisseria dentiae TaxID=194197 RepID=UPI0035A1BDA8